MRETQGRRALLLDLDRTLVDVQSYTDYEAACAELDEEFGDLRLIDMPESGWRSATHRAMAVLFSLAESPDEWTRADEIISRFESSAVNEAVPMPHLEEFISATSALPRAVVTLMGQTPAKETCRRFGIDIPVVIGRRVGIRPKPAPDQIVLGLKALGVKAGDAVMVGDSPWDADAAISAGAGFLGLTNSGPSVFSAETEVAQDLKDSLALL